MALVGHGEVEDGEGTAMFRDAGTEEVDGVVDPVAPVLGVDVVEEDEGVAVMLVLLVRPEKLHIVLSTATRFCCSTPKRQNSERERWGTERGNGGGGEGKGGGELGFAGAARGSSCRGGKRARGRAGGGEGRPVPLCFWRGDGDANVTMGTTGVRVWAMWAGWPWVVGGPGRPASPRFWFLFVFFL